MKRWLVAMALAALGATGPSCNVNPYCLNCDHAGDGGGDAPSDGPKDTPGGGDAGDGGPCVPSGDEVCDGIDNDCDGIVDEGPLPEVGDACDNQTGPCAGSTKICTNGHLHCTYDPSPEVCDNIDNDCDGVIDQGDPGGGASCGTNVGNCVAGVNHCIGGTVSCIGAMGTVNGQPEICDGQDNDCDGNFDEGLTNLGACGMSGQGTCQMGTLMCEGGGVVCVGAVNPINEICNNLDDDCDGFIDEDFNLDHNPNNCGSCGHQCALAHALNGCSGGQCDIASCEVNYYNNDGQTANGCEYGPCEFQGPVEACNGQDDNCNGLVDDNLGPPPNICAQAGECAGTVAVCDGANGWVCMYPSSVSVDANGNIIPETTCDGLDNDCDGNIDEGQPNLGDDCHDTGQGICQGTGAYICDPANLDGPAICNITDPGGSSTPEVCDGIDNDCDGLVDEGAATGNLPGQDWITIPGTSTQIMKWEASRPDASTSDIGLDTHFACSKQSVLPWTSLTYPQAAAACTSVGARLCTEAEWQNMCAQVGAPTYPVAGPVAATDFVFLEAEQAYANVTVNGHTWTSNPQQNYSGTTSLQALPDSGTTSTAAQSLTRSPRLEFRATLAANATYYLWVRIRAPDPNTYGVWVSMAQGTTATAGLNFQLAPPYIDTWTWIPSTGMNTTATAGTYTFSVFMEQDGVMVDAVAIAKQGTTPPAQNENVWAYSTNPKTIQPQICNDNEFDTNTAIAGDQDDVLPTGSMAACYANGGTSAHAYDLSGNVKEWTAARATNQNPIRGGAADNDAIGTSCNLNFTLADNTFFFPNVGFRCCR
ncbi:MAG TPA: MopE-related protein [Kofleriaceae bacterium]